MRLTWSITVWDLSTGEKVASYSTDKESVTDAIRQFVTPDMDKHVGRIEAVAFAPMAMAQEQEAAGDGE